VSEREDSYYEISLTHRQVMWVFIVLLACVATAFFAGLWLGQEPGSDAPLVIRADEEPTAEGSADDLEPLRFFAEDEQVPEPAVENPAKETRSQPTRRGASRRRLQRRSHARSLPSHDRHELLSRSRRRRRRPLLPGPWTGWSSRSSPRPIATRRNSWSIA
jgi:hypothetical protein